MENGRVRIFDTTLRDGEQSPGISLNKQEKLEIAHQLARLGVLSSVMSQRSMGGPRHGRRGNRPRRRFRR